MCQALTWTTILLKVENVMSNYLYNFDFTTSCTLQ
uniref:Uncharacterized protein n=1 Tax=Arundo donax TaxID=35708 RepID=A0A0A9FG19_ARUDO